VQSRIPRVSGVIRSIYVDASPKLTAVASAGSGTLLDANATDFLVLDGGSLENSLVTDTLRLVHRASGQSTVLYSALQEQAREGALFANGAIFLTREAAQGQTVREWRNGSLSTLAAEVVSFKAKVPFAIWWAPPDGLTRRDLSSGTSLTIPGAGNTRNDVAATGEVAYWSSNPYEIFLHDGGTATQLTDDGDGDFANTYPVTDGIHVVYRRQAVPPIAGTHSIRLSDAGGEITLAANLLQSPEPGVDYQVSEGWIAFVRPDLSNTRQIWRRSATGAETQVSAFGASSAIESMGPDGEIVFTTNATGSERRYRARVGGSPEDIGSGLGRSIYVDGQLHVMIGATLLRVD
jgi:hypothetical protein